MHRSVCRGRAQRSPAPDLRRAIAQPRDALPGNSRWLATRDAEHLGLVGAKRGEAAQGESELRQGRGGRVLTEGACQLGDTFREHLAPRRIGRRLSFEGEPDGEGRVSVAGLILVLVALNELLD